MQAKHSSGRSKMKSDATSSTISERSSSGCIIGKIAAVALDLDRWLWLLLSRRLEFYGRRGRLAHSLNNPEING
ncbi:hypothetical protein TB1_042757 [Malus domestica]